MQEIDEIFSEAICSGILRSRSKWFPQTAQGILASKVTSPNAHLPTLFKVIAANINDELNTPKNILLQSSNETLKTVNYNGRIDPILMEQLLKPILSGIKTVT